MQVLERKEWKKEVYCKDCKSLLELDKDDVRVERQGSFMYYFVLCAACQQRVSLNSADVAEHVKAFAASRSNGR